VPGHAAHRDLAAVPLDDRLWDRQVQPAAPCKAARTANVPRKKRVNSLRLPVRGDADAGVADLDLDVLAADPGGQLDPAGRCARPGR